MKLGGPYYYSDSYDEDEMELHSQEQEDEERDSAIQEVADKLENAREELKDYQDAHNGRCPQCEATMIQGVYCHETGCPANAKINKLMVQLEAMENY